MQRVYDMVSRENAEAEQYDGTPEGLKRVCALKGVVPATEVVHDDGTTMLHVGEHLMMVSAGDFVVAPTQRALSGDIYTPEEFAKRFRAAEVN